MFGACACVAVFIVLALLCLVSRNKKRVFGAGCIPYCTRNGEVLFLFHYMTGTSKKAGFFVDCGGAKNNGEVAIQTAIREFHEETKWIYAQHLGFSHAEALKYVEDLLLSSTESMVTTKPCFTYTCFFVPLPYLPESVISTAWKEAKKSKEKPREFRWLSIQEMRRCISTPNGEESALYKPFWGRLEPTTLLEQFSLNVYLGMRWWVIASRWPEIRATAASLHTTGLMDIIRKHITSCKNISFISPHSTNEHKIQLEEEGINCFQYDPNEDQFDHHVQRETPDVVLFDRFIMEEQYAWRLPSSVFKILDTQDLNFLRKARERYVKEHQIIAPAGKIDIDYESDTFFQRELSSIHRSDLVLVVSHFEKKYLCEQYGIAGAKIVVAPFWYDMGQQNADVPFNTRQHFMMLGNFLHPPNVDALRWCSSTLWSKLRKSLPTAELHVYGAYPTKHAKSFHKPNIGLYVHGPVVSLDSIFKKYRVNFAPLRFGAGIKGKITDGWFYNIPCVTTPIGREGITPTEDFGGLTGDSVDQLVDAATTLYTDEVMWKQCVTTGRNILKQHFCKETNGFELAGVLQDAIKDKEGIRKRNYFGSLLHYNKNRSTEYFSRYINVKNQLKELTDKPNKESDK